jgi:hypothetical protein
MFGNDNSKPLLLPIIFDLANLIREGFLRSDRHREHEKQNRHQFLRRSFNTRPHATNISSSSSNSMKEIDFAAPVSYLRDDTMMVDDDMEPIVKSIEKIEDIKSAPLMQVLNKNISFSTNNSIPVTLTRSHPTMSAPKNISMEEIENLALSNLNGTVKNDIKDVNGSEISPMALVGRHRKRPFHHQQQQRFQPGPLPETCERFTGKLLQLRHLKCAEKVNLFNFFYYLAAAYDL